MNRFEKKKASRNAALCARKTISSLPSVSKHCADGKNRNFQLVHLDSIFLFFFISLYLIRWQANQPDWFVDLWLGVAALEASQIPKLENLSRRSRARARVSSSKIPVSFFEACCCPSWIFTLVFVHLRNWYVPFYENEIWETGTFHLFCGAHDGVAFKAKTFVARCAVLCARWKKRCSKTEQNN